MNPNQLFIDYDFKPEKSFLNSLLNHWKDIEWKRPQVDSDSYQSIIFYKYHISTNKRAYFLKDLSERPCLGICCIDSNDIKQGILENCAFVSACSSISKYPSLIKKVNGSLHIQGLN